MASQVNTICRKDYNGQKLVYYPIVIIGAGESGIAAGCQLKARLGTDQFRIFDRRAGAGGVWYTSRYPGVAGDVPAVAYSFSFNQKPSWCSDLHPPGHEIRQYLNDTIDDFRIRQNLQLNTDIASVRWIEPDNEWELQLSHLVEGAGDLPTDVRKSRLATDPKSILKSVERVRAKIIISCVGALVEPKELPSFPGSADFKGVIAHSSNWDPSTDLRDKNVMVIGSGSSATQIVPALIKPEFGAKSVLNVMRSPPWVEPGFSSPSGKDDWEKWVPLLTKTVPGFQNVMRKIVFGTMELEFMSIFSGDKAAVNRKKKGEFLLKFLRETAPEEYHEQLTPNYEVFCKRRVMGEDWLHSLNDERVELSTLPVTLLKEKTVVLGPGRMYPPQDVANSKVSNDAREVPIDVIIMANGYDAGNWLHPLEVYGRAGASLHDIWEQRGGAQAYLGQAMDGFPNFFIVHGPNTITGHSSVILASEMMIQHALHFIPLILDGTVDACEIKKEAEIAYTKDVQDRLKNSVWNAGGCSNWYNRNGWNSTVYPRSQVHFYLRCKIPRWNDWNGVYTKKGSGLYRMRLGRGLPKQVKALPTVVNPKPASNVCMPDLVKTESPLGLFSSGMSTPSEISEAQTPPSGIAIVDEKRKGVVLPGPDAFTSFPSIEKLRDRGTIRA